MHRLLSALLVALWVFGPLVMVGPNGYTAPLSNHYAGQPPVTLTRLRAREGAPDVPAVTVVAAARPPRLMPTVGAVARVTASALANLSYDPTSVYDQKGLSTVRGFSVQAPAELVDPFSGNLILRHTDLYLPGIAGLDLTLQRVYNSKIHRNYAARATGDPQRIANGMLFVPTSPLGLGWNLHLGRLVGAVNAGPNNTLPGPRYYERPDGSQHPFFQYTGPGCGDETTDVCLLTKQKENPYRLSTNEPWRLATADGRNITFGHEAFDGSTIIYYATEIRDVHGNRIQIVYHDNTIPGIAVQRDYFRHFIDYIIDSAGRQIEFTYAVVNPPDVVRLTGITANGQSYSYGYSSANPWPQTQAFLTSAQPPEGAPWRYEYRGLTNGECADNSKRWCELTKITYPTGGTIEYTFTDNTFWTHGNPASVHAVATRTVGGRDLTSAAWSYQYSRENNYTGDEHTVITRPDGSKEVYTYFGVGGSAYDPWGSAWKAGALLRKEIRDANNQVLQTETYEWEPSPALSQELWGDPWIGLDTGVFVPRLRQRTIQRGSLTWTTTHTSFNDLNNAPRCTTEQGPDGATRYRLHVYYGLTAEQAGGLLFRFNNLTSGEGLSYDPFDTNQCTQQQGAISPPDDRTYGYEWYVYQYNGDGQVTMQEINGRRVRYQYHGDGSLKAEITYQDESQNLGFCTLYDHYERGVAKQITYGANAPPVGSQSSCSGGIYTVQRTLTWFGQVESETNGRNFTTQFQYDGLGRVVQITPPPQSGEAQITIDYDGSAARPNTKRRTTQGAYWVETQVDGFGRRLAVETAAGVHTRQEYDALGRVRFQSLPGESAGSTVGDTFTYDTVGRITQVEHADGSTVQYDYDANAYRVRITDEEGRVTWHTRRAFDNPEDFWLMRVQLPGEPEPTSDTYTYLVGGHLTGIYYTGRYRTLEYNFARQVRHEYNPESGNVYYGYDDAGNLRCRSRLSDGDCSDSNWNSSSADVRYTVDGLGRVTEMTYRFLTPNVTFTYDNADNLTTMTDGVGTHRFDYTATDRLRQRVSIISSVAYTTTYQYDDRGNLDHLTYPSGRTVTYGYDAGNRVISVREGGTAYVTSIDYHPNGTARSMTYGNGVVTSLTLDTRQRPDVLSSSHGVLNLDYGYDDVGNVTSLVDAVNPDNTTTFVYDDLDRLQDAFGSWGNLHYEYSAAGDRIREVLDGQETIYSYNSLGRLDNLNGRINLAFGYDSYGNINRRGDFYYSYDLENRLTSVSGPRSVQYGYDGQGQRMRVSRAGCNADRIYHYDQEGNRIAESTEDGLILKEYIVVGRRTVAELDLRPQLHVAPTEIDFGDVEVRTSITRTITLTNTSSVPITLTSLSLVQPFRLAGSSPVVVPAGQTLQVPVVFEPSARSTYTGKLSTCEDNGIQFDVALRGRGVAAVAVISPSQLDLGDVPLGTVVTRTLVLSSTGDIPLRVTGWQAGDSALSVTPDGATTLSPGSAYTLTLTFDSRQACGGAHFGEIILDSNSLSTGRVSVRANILALEVAERDVNFGPLDIGVTRTLTVTLINRATVPLTPTVTLDGAPQFQLGSLPSSRLSPGARLGLPIAYQPGGNLWSPFGDHATLKAGFQGCAAGCGTTVHLIGNVLVETAPITGIWPTLAVVSDTLHLAAPKEGRGSWYETSVVTYTVHSSGNWTLGPDPTDGSWDAWRPAFLPGPDGKLTMLWHEGSYRNTPVKLRQRTNHGVWGDVCTVPGVRNGRTPVALDAGGATWLTWNENGLRAGPIFSAAGVCQSGQTPPIVTGQSWSSVNLTTASSGTLALAGVTSGGISVATLDPTQGTISAETVVTRTGDLVAEPLLVIDTEGGWHLTWTEVFYGQDYTPEVFYAYRPPGGAWGQPISVMDGAAAVDLVSDFGSSLNMVVDSLGNVHLAWKDETCADSSPGEVRYKVYYAIKPASGNQWQISDVSTPGYTDFDASLTLALQDDRLVAAWGAVPASGSPAEFLVGETQVGARAGDCPARRYDVMPDGRIDIRDVQAVAGRWRARQGGLTYVPAYDLNDDGVINLIDIMEVTAAWGQCP